MTLPFAIASNDPRMRDDYNLLKNKYPNIKWNVIAGHEGKPLIDTAYAGYYPKTTEKDSGVTIGLGVDLSRWDIDDLNISNNLKNKLRPYGKYKEDTDPVKDPGGWKYILGPTGNVAKSMIATPGPGLLSSRRNLRLSKHETNELNLAVGTKIYNKLSNNYANQTGKNLQDAPKPVQTTLMSMAWNVGPDFNYSDTWTAVNNGLNTGSWDRLIRELKSNDWSKSTISRRNDEGIYLEKQLSKSKVK